MKFWYRKKKLKKKNSENKNSYDTQKFRTL